MFESSGTDSRWRWKRIAVWTISATLALSLGGFVFVYWWTAPQYLPKLLVFSDVTLDGVLIDDSPLRLDAGRDYKFSCTVRSNGKKFNVVDSGEVPYMEPLPFIAESGPERPKDQFDPTFNVAFSSSFRLGRALGSLMSTRAKTALGGESVALQRTIRTPSIPGRYQFQIVWSHNPDGWVQIDPTRWTQRTPNFPSILWQRNVSIEKK